MREILDLLVDEYWEKYRVISRGFNKWWSLAFYGKFDVLRPLWLEEYLDRVDIGKDKRLDEELMVIM